ncbi:hypothetical protein HK101_006217, partial [Irineochytrium annulatum]
QKIHPDLLAFRPLFPAPDLGLRLPRHISDDAPPGLCHSRAGSEGQKAAEGGTEEDGDGWRGRQ